MFWGFVYLNEHSIGTGLYGCILAKIPYLPQAYSVSSNELTNCIHFTLPKMYHIIVRMRCTHNSACWHSGNIILCDEYCHKWIQLWWCLRDIHVRQVCRYLKIQIQLKIETIPYVLGCKCIFIHLSHHCIRFVWNSFLTSPWRMFFFFCYSTSSEAKCCFEWELIILWSQCLCHTMTLIGRELQDLLKDCSGNHDNQQGNVNDGV